MKRFIGIAALSFLAIWVIFKAFAASPAESTIDTTQVKDTGEMRKIVQSGDISVPVICLDMKIAPVFDPTGAVVSDPTGTMLDPNHSECTAVSEINADVKIAPVFDSNGEVVSDPTGTILWVIYSGDNVFSLNGSDVKIAPIFDATGELVSDPTGTTSGEVNP